MTPLEKARKVFVEFYPDEDFEVVVQEHIERHYVSITPQWFALAKMVRRTARDTYAEDGVKNMFHATVVATSDTSGRDTIQRLLELVPVNAEFLSLTRRGQDRLRIFRVSKLKQKAQCYGQRS